MRRQVLLNERHRAQKYFFRFGWLTEGPIVEFKVGLRGTTHEQTIDILLCSNCLLMFGRLIVMIRP